MSKLKMMPIFVDELSMNYLKGKKMSAKLIKFNLSFVIPTTQLQWTKHALERLQERKIPTPSKRSKWELIEKCFNHQHNNTTWSLRQRIKGQDLIIIVEKVWHDEYKVITAYWDGNP